MTTMAVAIAAPSSVPFVVGGAERLWWGLQEYINRNTAHCCELVKVCAPGGSFRELLESYDRFDRLDLNHFDAVLTTRYPAWMVRHPNHHIYFQHPLRVLYDRYPGPKALAWNVQGYPGVKKVLDALDRSPLSVRRLIDCSLELACDPGAPEKALRFPGPLVRKIVHTLDRHAISRAKTVSAISKSVLARRGYFPDPRAVRVVYHPTNLQGLGDCGREYFFTASRMVPAKRIHLIIEAYLKAGLNLPLKIAGSGPEMPFLRKVAAGNRLVQFTGFVSDHDLAALYSHALAVVFVPENEDYGLVTLEAMRAGKPVITCSDSGGPAELVSHDRTGWVCPPDAGALARAMRQAGSDFLITAMMGRQAHARVKRVTWQTLVSEILEPMASAQVGQGFRSLRI